MDGCSVPTAKQSGTRESIEVCVHAGTDSHPLKEVQYFSTRYKPARASIKTTSQYPVHTSRPPPLNLYPILGIRVCIHVLQMYTISSAVMLPLHTPLLASHQRIGAIAAADAPRASPEGGAGAGA